MLLRLYVYSRRIKWGWVSLQEKRRRRLELIGLEWYTGLKRVKFTTLQVIVWDAATLVAVTLRVKLRRASFDEWGLILVLEVLLGVILTIVRITRLEAWLVYRLKSIILALIVRVSFLLVLERLGLLNIVILFSRILRLPWLFVVKFFLVFPLLEAFPFVGVSLGLVSVLLSRCVTLLLISLLVLLIRLLMLSWLLIAVFFTFVLSVVQFSLLQSLIVKLLIYFLLVLTLLI